MPILLGILSSIGIGISDYLGRYCTRRNNATTTVLTALIGGIVSVVVLIVIVPSEIRAADMGLGALSGLTIGFALMLTYWGMAVSSSAVVSPAVAFFVAVIPLTWDISRGASLSTMASVGIAIAITGIVATTISPELEGKVGAGLLLATGSGLLFGIGMSVVGETTVASGVWPALGQRIVAWATLFVYAMSRSLSPLLPSGTLARRGLLSGVAGAGGMAAFIVGAQRGSLGPVAVSASMFPAVTVLLAFVFDDDKLRWWQALGIGAALLGVGLIAAG